MLVYSVLLIIVNFLFLPIWLIVLWHVPKLRAGLKQKLGLQLFSPPKYNIKPRKRLWIHCVSVGELNAAAPLIKVCSKSYDVVISTTTETGQKLARQQFSHLDLCYCPLDFPWAVARAYRELAPDALIVLETELWPNLFTIVGSQIPLLVVNARLSAKSFKRYLWIKPLMAGLFVYCRQILAQTEEDRNRFQTLGARQVSVGGNLKFDIPLTVPADKTVWQAVLSSGAQPVIVFASTHDQEETVLLPVIQWLLTKSVRCVIAPRHPERGSAVASLLKEAAVPCLRRSETPALLQQVLPMQTVLVLDTIGELMSIYAASGLAVLGGSFISWGGHNPLEPVSVGTPVIFGPSMQNFKAITQELLQVKGAIQVTGITDLQSQLAAWLQKPEILRETVYRSQVLIKQSGGATQRVMDLLQTVLEKEEISLS